VSLTDVQVKSREREHALHVHAFVFLGFKFHLVYLVIVIAVDDSLWIFFYYIDFVVVSILELLIGFKQIQVCAAFCFFGAWYFRWATEF
jgi:hypothetical protein